VLKNFLITIIVFLVLIIGIDDSQLAFAGSGQDGDIDQDSFTPNEGDCDDNDPTINPGALEIPGDGIDQDCDGVGAIVAGQVIGGEILPIHTTSLLLAGAQSTTWMIPVVLSMAGIGLFVVSRKSQNS